MKFIRDTAALDPLNNLNVVVTGRCFNDDDTPLIDVRNGKQLALAFKGHDLDEAHLQVLLAQEEKNIAIRESLVPGRDAALAEQQAGIGKPLAVVSSPVDPDADAKRDAFLLSQEVAKLKIIAKEDDATRLAKEAELDAVYKLHPDWFGITQP